jgi:hypothetical protein
MFSTSDNHGHEIHQPAVVTVKKGPQGPCTVDPRAPGNVRHLRAHPGNNVVRLTWRRPRAADFDHVRIVRTLIAGTRPHIFFRRRSPLVDRTVRNGVRYRYTVYGVDHAGNRSPGVFVDVTPHRILLLRPRDGARVYRPPTFVWVRKARATYYNIQIYRARPGRVPVQVFSGWPHRARLALPRRWRFNGRIHTLRSGRYVWYVWPGFGRMSAVHYGGLMGQSRFLKRKPR